MSLQFIEEALSSSNFVMPFRAMNPSGKSIIDMSEEEADAVVEKGRRINGFVSMEDFTRIQAEEAEANKVYVLHEMELGDAIKAVVANDYAFTAIYMHQDHWRAESAVRDAARFGRFDDEWTCFYDAGEKTDYRGYPTDGVLVFAFKMLHDYDQPVRNVR